MTRVIQNYKELATTKTRIDALEIVEAAFDAIDTKSVLEKNITVIDGIMTVMGQRFILADYKRIYIIGFGKVSCKAAYVLEGLLQGKVQDGAVIGIKEVTCDVVDTYAGTHPLPSHLNFTATKHIEEIATKATGDDLVLVVVSGGGSALLCSSLEECDQGQRLYEAFLGTGGTIEEMNTVRRHISKLKGGGLAKMLFPATVVGLIFSDVPGGDMASIASGPTFPDSSSVADAQVVIDKYGLGTYHLTPSCDDEQYFKNVHNILMTSNLNALHAMEHEAKKRGYEATVVSATHYETLEETVALFAKKRKLGSMLSMGGETKLHVPKEAHGSGGRSTQLALSMLTELKPGEVFVSFASDGKDNCPAAGVIVDEWAMTKVKKLGLSIEEYKKSFDTYTFFLKTKDLILTGPLESNVADLMLLLSPTNDKV